MKCQICEKEFNPVRKNQACCSNGCKKERERRWQADYYQKIKGTRVLTEEQIETNKDRNRNKYRNMDPEEKRLFLAEKRRKYHESKKGK